MAKRIRYAVAAGVALVALGTGACSTGGSEPTETSTWPTAAPSTSTSVTPSAPPTSSTTTAPVPAFPKTSLGARDFARYFLTEVNRGYRALDPRVIRAVSTSECLACEQWAKGIETLRAVNHRLSADYVTVVYVYAGNLNRDIASVQTSIRADPLDVLDGKGALVRTRKAYKASLFIFLRYSNGWHVVGTEQKA